MAGSAVLNEEGSTLPTGPFSVVSDPMGRPSLLSPSVVLVESNIQQENGPLS